MESTRQPVQLPTTKLTIPAPSSHSHTTTSSSNYRPSSLKIRITPHLLLPSPPFAPGASGKKIEDCVDVIVAVGGKVDVGIEVEEDGLEWAEGLGDVEEVIKTRVEGLFQAVSYRAIEGSSTAHPEESGYVGALKCILSSPRNTFITTSRISAGIFVKTRLPSSFSTYIQSLSFEYPQDSDYYWKTTSGPIAHRYQARMGAI